MKTSTPDSPQTPLNIHGFTLIELLVVVTIITVLLALMLPALGEAKRQSSRSACASNLKQTGIAIEFYRNDFSDVYPAAADPMFYAGDTGKWIWLWMGRGWRELVGPYIARGIDADNPNILVCPQEIAPRDNYTNTSYNYAMCFYHSPDQINQMKDKTWTYGNPAGKLMPPVAVSSGRVAEPARKILAGEWFSNHRPLTGHVNTEPGWWSRVGTRNYLFADGHGEYLAADQIKPANDNCSNPNLTIDGVEGTDR